MGITGREGTAESPRRSLPRRARRPGATAPPGVAAHKGLGRATKFRFLIGQDERQPQTATLHGARRAGVGLMQSRVDEQQQRRLIAEYFGAGSRLRLLRQAPTFGAPVFVVDFDRGIRHYRTLGSFGPSFGTVNLADPQVTEQSSMDLLYPAHLVFHYERLMSLAFALVERPVTALLLGVGGAAMWRFVRAYLPECAPTLVDADEAVVGIARRWFYLSQPVVIETAERFLAGNRQQFDVVLVDLYDARGPAPFDDAFWARCLDALKPGGCLATNWADFATNLTVRPMAEAQRVLARARGLDAYYVTRHGFRDNLVQYLPTGGERQAEAITGALERFARERRLPDRGRFFLEGCLISTEFPIAP